MQVTGEVVLIIENKTSRFARILVYCGGRRADGIEKHFDCPIEHQLAVGDWVHISIEKLPEKPVPVTVRQTNKADKADLQPNYTTA